MKLRDQIRKLPVGTVIAVAPEAMTLVRYHAMRQCRTIRSWNDAPTGKRAVYLGEFFATRGARENKT